LTLTVATAVKHFVLWGIEDLDQRMKPFFYPDLEKTALFELAILQANQATAAASTVDLTLLDNGDGQGVDMAARFRIISARFRILITGA
jgi:D-alanyl-D-alanine dipeptidase